MLNNLSPVSYCDLNIGCSASQYSCTVVTVNACAVEQCVCCNSCKIWQSWRNSSCWPACNHHEWMNTVYLSQYLQIPHLMCVCNLCASLVFFFIFFQSAFIFNDLGQWLLSWFGVFLLSVRLISSHCLVALFRFSSHRVPPPTVTF